MDTLRWETEEADKLQSCKKKKKKKNLRELKII